jgi:predicted ester cyclase
MGQLSATPELEISASGTGIAYFPMQPDSAVATAAAAGDVGAPTRELRVMVLLHYGRIATGCPTGYSAVVLQTGRRQEPLPRRRAITMTDSIEKHVAVVRTAFAKLEQGDLDACAEQLTEDFIINLPGLPEPLHGRETWKFGVKAMLDGFPDLRTTIEDIFGAGDRVAVRLHFSGTHTGSFQGVPPTHRHVAFSSIDIYRVEGDKIAEEWVSPDMMGLMRQISAPAHS